MVFRSLPPPYTSPLRRARQPYREEEELLPMDGAASAGGSGDPTANGEKPQEQQFDPSRMIGIIKRKALIKELAAAYHAECVACCKELLQLQRKWEDEQYVEPKMPEEPRTLMMKTSKRKKK